MVRSLDMGLVEGDFTLAPLLTKILLFVSIIKVIQLLLKYRGAAVALG